MGTPLPAALAAKYRVRRPLGAGGFATVFLATQVALDRPVALKILHAAALEDPGQRERFHNEARITAALSHRHIATLIDHGVEDGVPYIAYEYIEGESLRSVVNRGPLGIRDALVAASQVAQALECAHQKGIFHRDIKPENILVRSPEDLVVLDFGIAQWTEQTRVKTATGVVLGTPAYLSPEQINGERLTGHSDQYALGIMLYELLTGQTPYPGDNPIQVIEGHLFGTPPDIHELRHGVSAPVRELVVRAMSRDPDDRFDSAADLSRCLEELILQTADQAPVAVGPATARPQSQPTGVASSGRVPLPRTAAVRIVGAQTSAQVGRTSRLPDRVTSATQATVTTSPRQHRWPAATVAMAVAAAVGAGAGLLAIGWFARRAPETALIHSRRGDGSSASPAPARSPKPPPDPDRARTEQRPPILTRSVGAPHADIRFDNVGRVSEICSGLERLKSGFANALLHSDVELDQRVDKIFALFRELTLAIENNAATAPPHLGEALISLYAIAAQNRTTWKRASVHKHLGALRGLVSTFRSPHGKLLARLVYGYILNGSESLSKAEQQLRVDKAVSLQYEFYQLVPDLDVKHCWAIGSHPLLPHRYPMIPRTIPSRTGH